jgi:hypothetical protein
MLKYQSYPGVRESTSIYGVDGTEPVQTAGSLANPWAYPAESMIYRFT